MTPAWVDRAEYPFATRRVEIEGIGMSYVDEGAEAAALVRCFLEEPRRTA